MNSPSSDWTVLQTTTAFLGIPVLGHVASTQWAVAQGSPIRRVAFFRIRYLLFIHVHVSRASASPQPFAVAAGTIVICSWTLNPVQRHHHLLQSLRWNFHDKPERCIA